VEALKGLEPGFENWAGACIPANPTNNTKTMHLSNGLIAFNNSRDNLPF